MKQYILLLLAFLSTHILISQNKMTPELLWQLGRVSLNDVSPDGNTVVYSVRHYDIGANSGSSDLYAISTDGSDNGNAHQLTNMEGSEGDAKYLPDGSKIAFLHKGYLWAMNPDGTDAKEVSRVKMNGFKFSHKGNKILFIDDVKYDKSTQDRHPDLKKAEAKVIDGLMYRHWNEWEDGSYSNIFVADFVDGRFKSDPVNIMGEPFDSPLKPFGGMEQIDWSFDGNMVAYTCKKVRGTKYTVSTNSDIYLYNLNTKETTNLTEGMMGYDMNPAFSPNGRYLAWESLEEDGYESDRHRIFIYDFVTKKKWELTKGYHQNASGPQWKGNNRVYFDSPVDATYQMFYKDLDSTRDPIQVSNGRFNHGAFIVGKNNIVTSRCSMSQPHELVALEHEGKGRPMPLTMTNKNQLRNIEMGKVEKRMIKTNDGKDMLTWVIYPPGFDASKKYPTLLYCQGGPQSAVSQFWSYRWNFQMMAANGYVVVAPNRRGLPSFGEEWNDQIAGDWGGQAMQDLLTAIDEVAKEPYVDNDNLGAVGASFGGYSVYWLAGNHDGRFKSFISHCGLFNLESWYGTTEEMFFANHDLEGSYWQKDLPETWKLDSPHKYVQNWDTPLLVIHGGKDFRVPESEGMQAFQAAQLRGIPSKFLYFPEEGHWVSSPQNSILWQREFAGWLDKWLKVKP